MQKYKKKYQDIRKENTMAFYAWNEKSNIALLEEIKARMDILW